ncbi:MAG: DUF3847 domain-containing protein [Oscillospiraceae bacterium]|nr:DUF3847 domain-containing protein [Oscillospiraceae bacterium]
MRKNTNDKITSVEEQIKQLENQRKRLMQQQRAEENEARNKRCYRRGAYIESLVDGSPEMTDEQFYKVISTALNKQSPAKQTNTTLAPKTTDESKDEGAVTELA